MTRDQAARILHPDTREIAFVECINSDTRKWREDLEEAARMGAEALMEMREPDPETGLMPCGCGGKPVFIEFFDGFFDHERITCSECQIEFTTTSVGCGALLWNKAMGWRGDNES